MYRLFYWHTHYTWYQIRSKAYGKWLHGGNTHIMIKLVCPRNDLLVLFSHCRNIFRDVKFLSIVSIALTIRCFYWISSVSFVLTGGRLYNIYYTNSTFLLSIIVCAVSSGTPVCLPGYCYSTLLWYHCWDFDNLLQWFLFTVKLHGIMWEIILNFKEASVVTAGLPVRLLLWLPGEPLSGI